MASLASMRTLQPTQCAGTTPFEVGARPRRGRPQQCVRSAARKSSSRFASRGSSSGSRSSARSRRPSSEVELRSEFRPTPTAPTAAVFESLSEDDCCATGFISGVLNIAMDDITTEMDYFSDEECIMSPKSLRTPMKQVCDAAQVLSVDNLIANPSPIAEESTDDEECYPAPAQISNEEGNSLSFEMDDDLESCSFDDEVCSMASENPEGLEDIDEMLMATKVAKDAVSDDLIRGAFTFADFGKESEDEGCSDEERTFEYASGILRGASKGILSDELAEDHWPDEDTFVSDSEEPEAKAYAPRLQQQQQQYLTCLDNALSADVIEDQPEAKAYAPRLQQQQQQYLTCLENTLSAPVIEDHKAYAPRVQQQQQQYHTCLENTLSTHVEEYHVEFADEPPFCGEGLAFDFASTILDGAIVQAATTCKEQEEVQLNTHVLHKVRKQLDLEGIRFKAKQALLKAATGRGFLATSVAETQDVTNIESLKRMARECLVQAAQVQLKAKAEDLRSNVEFLVKAVSSGDLERALGQVTQKTDAMQDEAATINDCTSTSEAVQQVLMEASASSKLQAALSFSDAPLVETVQPAEEMISASPSRNLHSSRSRRRIIGGVVRAPAVQHDIFVTSASPRKQYSKSDRKAASQAKSFSMDMGLEPVGEEDMTPGRSSSLTRSYDTLGAQFYSHADADELPYAVQASPSRGSAKKPSKARAKFHAASMSAMSMDLAEGASVSSSTSALKFSMDQFASPRTSRGSFTPVPLNLGHKMRPSSSVGSLNLDQKGSFSAVKVTKASGGLLPSLLPEKKSAESIAWSMNVSKTQSQWRNTGLRGSASMIF